MLLAPEQLCGSSIIVIFFRASNASFFFWSDNVFFLNNNKKYFVPCNCWWFYSISLYHAEAFLLHVRFFFNSCRISPVKTKCLTNQWRKKEFICDVFFIWPLPFFYTNFIHSLRERKKNGKNNRTVLFSGRLYNLVYLLQSLQCTCIHTMYHSICMCVCLETTMSWTPKKMRQVIFCS